MFTASIAGEIGKSTISLVSMFTEHGRSHEGWELDIPDAAAHHECDNLSGPGNTRLVARLPVLPRDRSQG